MAKEKEVRTKILNYRIIIEADKRTGPRAACFTAICPTLGIASDGETVEESLSNVKEAISAYLAALGEPVAADQTENCLITSTRVRVAIT